MSKKSISKASQTDWGRIDAMRDEDIDLSDIPEVTREQVAGAVLRVDRKPVPKGKICVPILLDEELLDSFKTRAGERGYERLIVEALETYIREHTSEEGTS